MDPLWKLFSVANCEVYDLHLKQHSVAPRASRQQATLRRALAEETQLPAPHRLRQSAPPIADKPDQNPSEHPGLENLLSFAACVCVEFGERVSIGTSPGRRLL